MRALGEELGRVTVRMRALGEEPGRVTVRLQRKQTRGSEEATNMRRGPSNPGWVGRVTGRRKTNEMAGIAVHHQGYMGNQT